MLITLLFELVYGSATGREERERMTKRIAARKAKVERSEMGKPGLGVLFFSDIRRLLIYVLCMGFGFS